MITLNIYNFHSEPESLELYHKSNDELPGIFFKKYKDQPGELKNREDVIAKSPYFSYIYARDVLNRSFPKGEKILATDGKFAYFYARYVLGERFPKGEDVIATHHAEWAYRYAKEILEGPFPKGEDIIATDYRYAFFYAKEILQGPFPKGEKAIIDSIFKDDYKELTK